MNIFTRRELHITYDLDKFNQLRSTLYAAGIKTSYRCINTTGSNRGRYGTLGINHDFTYQYYIYVHKKDYERAKYILNV
ncbi:hypothetical protein I5677_09885 [Mobilitalea sibirica]|uniref:DUF2007 domain-containing protein n=1 Tax=Mobilitalea sibirica TaxID=1462919 RepID=A0A8J7HBK5_9FIRM|nr:hypothetical protein [Mobilitalea sibirica]MBH1941201.1 hypothetical protein [Mobilitalea sibirica]